MRNTFRPTDRLVLMLVTLTKALALATDAGRDTAEQDGDNEAGREERGEDLNGGHAACSAGRAR